MFVKCTVVCVLLLMAVAPQVSAQDSIPATFWTQWTLEQAGLYMQCQYHSDTTWEGNAKNDLNFTNPRFRPSLRLRYQTWLRLYGQIQVKGSGSTLLMQAYSDILYELPGTDSAYIRVGQFTNGFMFMAPPPNRKHFVDYGLTDFYVASQYPQGIVASFWMRTVGLSFGLVNGGGMNRPDNNSELDVLVYGQWSPCSNLLVRGGFQTGQQPKTNRQTAYVSMEYTPVQPLSVSGALAHHATDSVTSWGWLTTLIYRINPHLNGVARVVQRTNHPRVVLEKNLTVTWPVEVTGGIEYHTGPVKLQLNTIFVRKDYGVAAELQTAVF